MQLFQRQAAPVDRGQAYPLSHLLENKIHCDVSFGVSQDGELLSGVKAKVLESADGEHKSKVGGIDG